MVRLEVLSGKKAGAKWVARRFPVRLGRSDRADFQSDEAGVWDHHAEISSSPTEGWSVQAGADALLSVNGKPVERAVLRNGDVLDLGSLKLRFWLADARQKGLALREGLVWAGLIVVVLGQAALLYWLQSSVFTH
jgi:hypothetical protein